MPHPITYLCPECHSTNVGWEATAFFNTQSQDHELSDYYECNGYCRECDMDDLMLRPVPIDSEGNLLPVFEIKAQFHPEGAKRGSFSEYFATLAIGKAHYPDLPEEAWVEVKPEEIAYLSSLVTEMPYTAVLGETDPGERYNHVYSLCIEIRDSAQADSQEALEIDAMKARECLQRRVSDLFEIGPDGTVRLSNEGREAFGHEETVKQTG